MNTASIPNAVSWALGRLLRKSRITRPGSDGSHGGRLGRVSAFRRDRRGIAAVEFALILPIMITFCFCLAELCNAVENYRKVVLYTRVVADLSGRTSVGSMTSVFSAASAVLLPYDASTVKVRVSAIGVKKQGNTLTGRVCSSVASNTTARPVNQQAGTSDLPDVPDAFVYDDAHYVFAEVTMPYKPLVGSSFVKRLFGNNGLTFNTQLPWADRTDTEIIMPGGSKCS